MKNKLWAVRIPYFKLSIITLLIGLSPATYGQAFKLSPEDKAIVEQAKQLQNNAHNIIDSDWLSQAKSNMQTENAQRFVDELNKSNPLHSQIKNAKPNKNGLDGNYSNIIFISYSLGEQALKEILKQASDDPTTLLVMRGIPEGTKIWEGMKQLQMMAISFNPVPNIILNPALFKKFNIEHVPTILKIENNESGSPSSKDNLVEIARVKGMTDPTWMNKRIEDGDKGDMGVRGPMVEIAEPDLIEMLKARVATIDWEEKKAGALSRVWKNQQFYPLPKATKEDVRKIDPALVVTKDITGEKGEIIAKKGDTYNPLDMLPFDFALMVFDPLDQKQVEIAKHKAEQLLDDPSISQVIYLATQIDRDKGWDFFNDLTDQLDAHVFLLTPDIISRFELRHVPSIVTADDKHFVITELEVNKEILDIPVD